LFINFIYLSQDEEVRKVLRLYEDDELCKVFDESAGHSGTLPAKHLKKALNDLDVSPEIDAHPMNLDDFKRLARQPSEAETWIHSMPLAGVLARSFDYPREWAKFSEEEVSRRLQVFNLCVGKLVREKIKRWKEGTCERPGIISFPIVFHSMRV